MSLQDPELLIVHNASKQMIVLKNITHVSELGGESVFHTVSDKNDDITIPIPWLELKAIVKNKISRYPNNLRFVIDLD